MSTYEELKKKRDAAEKARDKAQAVLSDTYEEYKELLLAHNAGLPNGWYVDAESQSEDEFLLYAKRGDQWWVLDSPAFVTPDWAEYDSNDHLIFDVEVIPLSEVKW